MFTVRYNSEDRQTFTVTLTRQEAIQELYSSGYLVGKDNKPIPLKDAHKLSDSYITEQLDILYNPYHA